MKKRLAAILMAACLLLGFAVGRWTAGFSWERESAEETTEPVIEEKYPQVPLYYQTDYPKVRYGRFGTVATSGCGITCVAMVASYLLDREILPDEMAEKYGRFSIQGGSDWTLFPTSAADLGLILEETTANWETAVKALENGQVIITQAGKQSLFTDVGHFIVLTGITEDGKILVNDPYKGNYSEWADPRLQEGFANGFEQKQISQFCTPYWIYAPKSEVWDPYARETAPTEAAG